MSHWNIHMEIPSQGTKDIDIYDETTLDIQIIMNQLIRKYAGINFFGTANKTSDAVFRTEFVTVIIMNDNFGSITFHQDLAVKVITVAKREMYLLHNII